LYVDKTLTKGDIVPLVDLDAVKNSVRNLLLTNRYERPFQPAIGGNLQRYLFEPADQFTLFAISQDIRLTLENYEPRIDQVNVIADFNEDDNEYLITLAFRVITPNQRTDMTVRLTRLR
jgi:phage baseplate assembly protein W